MRRALQRGWAGALEPEEGERIAGIEALRRRAEADPRIGEFTRRASKPPRSARILFSLVRELRPRSCVELGSGVGISTAYQAAALALNGDGGRLVSLDLSETRVDAARRHLRALGLDNARLVLGTFDETLEPTLVGLGGAADFVFVDGHHDERATLQYFTRILPFAAPSAVFVFDDIRWSKGMERAWRTLSADRSLRLTLDLGEMGIALADARRREYS